MILRNSWPSITNKSLSLAVCWIPSLYQSSSLLGKLLLSLPSLDGTWPVEATCGLPQFTSAPIAVVLHTSCDHTRHWHVIQEVQSHFQSDSPSISTDLLLPSFQQRLFKDFVSCYKLLHLGRTSHFAPQRIFPSFIPFLAPHPSHNSSLP